MTDLTERQVKILKTIIDDYIQTAEPVGSEKLDKKYSLEISPATIRNEMVKLTKLGFLRQPHASAGRIPTPIGFKLYIDSLMDEKKLSVTDEVAAKEAVWDYRFEFDRLMREVTKTLAQRTGDLALASTSDGDIYSAGSANILEMPEFFDIDVTRNVLELLDESRRLQGLFDRAFGEDSIHVLMAEELQEKLLEPCSLVFTHFQVGSKKTGAIGIIGPCRLNYREVIPNVRYFGDLITEITKTWSA
jgi:transcriptional regulator of heat shock response